MSYQTAFQLGGIQMEKALGAKLVRGLLRRSFHSYDPILNHSKSFCIVVKLMNSSLSQYHRSSVESFWASIANLRQHRGW